MARDLEISIELPPRTPFRYVPPDQLDGMMGQIVNEGYKRYLACLVCRSAYAAFVKLGRGGSYPQPKVHEEG